MGIPKDPCPDQEISFVSNLMEVPYNNFVLVVAYVIAAVNSPSLISLSLFSPSYQEEKKTACDVRENVNEKHKSHKNRVLKVTA